jgi:hypothetical protein
MRAKWVGTIECKPACWLQDASNLQHRCVLISDPMQNAIQNNGIEVIVREEREIFGSSLDNPQVFYGSGASQSKPFTEWLHRYHLSCRANQLGDVPGQPAGAGPKVQNPLTVLQVQIRHQALAVLVLEVAASLIDLRQLGVVVCVGDRERRRHWVGW